MRGHEIAHRAPPANGFDDLSTLRRILPEPHLLPSATDYVLTFELAKREECVVDIDQPSFLCRAHDHDVGGGLKHRRKQALGLAQSFLRPFATRDVIGKNQCRGLADPFNM